MKKLALVLVLSLLSLPALAQTKFTMPPPAGVVVGGVQVVATCGAASGLVAGNTAFMAMDTTGTLCTASGGGGGGSVTQGTVPWVVSGQGTAGTAASGVVTVQGIASMTKLLVTPDSVALPANQSVNVAQINATTPLMGNGVTGTGSARVTIASDNTAFSVNAVESGTWTVQPGNTANTTPWLVTPTVATSGGMSTAFLQPAASDNHTVLKAGAGQLYWVTAFNNSATVNYLRFYDATTGFNGCNSATNLITQLQIPASTSVGGFNIPLPFGVPFATGISYCVTSGYATNDTTNATATAMSITFGYK